MPNYVVDAVHRLAAASKQAGGITFTNKDGNIITNDDDEETEKIMENEPTPVTDDDHEEIINTDKEETNEETITGADEQDTENAHDNTLPILQDQDKTITGVDNEQNMENTLDNTQSFPEEENDPDEYVTISYINISLEMNTSHRGSESEPTENEEMEPGHMSYTIYDQDQKIEYNLH